MGQKGVRRLEDIERAKEFASIAGSVYEQLSDRGLSNKEISILADLLKNISELNLIEH